MKTPDLSFAEQCINALPLEKQAAARVAYKDIAEGGGDNIFSKVLVTLEATGAFFERVPRAVSNSGEKLLHEFDLRTERLSREQAQSEARLEEQLRKLLVEQTPVIGKALSLDQVVSRLDAQTAELGRINRGVSRLRRARIGGMLLIMLLGALIGSTAIVGLFWKNYKSAQDAERLFSRMRVSGIAIHLSDATDGNRLTIEGPRILTGPGWKKNANGQVVGASLLFSADSQP